MKPAIQTNKIVVFSGAGISAECGIATYRGAGGLWSNAKLRELATTQAWQNSPELVLDFYNQRKALMQQAQPNAAHLAIAQLETQFDVVVITHNVDDLHERAGSSQVLHLHGQLNYAISSAGCGRDAQKRYCQKKRALKMGDLADDGQQLRPDVVLFGEVPYQIKTAKQHFASAQRVLVVGSSLQVLPAAKLLNKARFHAEKIIISLDLDKRPFGFEFIKGKASIVVPAIVRQWGVLYGQ